MTRAQTLGLAHETRSSRGPGDAIKASLLQTDAELMADPTVHSQRSGTTAVIPAPLQEPAVAQRRQLARRPRHPRRRRRRPTTSRSTRSRTTRASLRRITTCGGLVSEATPEDGEARVWFAPNSGHASGPGLALSRVDRRPPLAASSATSPTRHPPPQALRGETNWSSSPDTVWGSCRRRRRQLVSTFTNATDLVPADARSAIEWSGRGGGRRQGRDDITAIVVFMLRVGCRGEVSRGVHRASVPSSFV